ncbi:hypothetical protein GQ44DRAFT_652030 [Phaeosphaeriaceae sp. PMI808]|nr:hypothetical protein GQ44DRAFT_652030 [Phaeosphaeriaceae sp. PMI808]
MSLRQGIGAPFTLATLTKPVSSTNGRTHASSVCSISGIKKRKRTEIAVGLDGEGISIYSLQNPQLVTAYALPSSASFTCAPYSIYRKGSSKTTSQRFTYASVSGSTTTDKAQLICFHERSLGDRSKTVKSIYTPSNNAQLLTIDVLPISTTDVSSAPSAMHHVLATFDNGDIICLSADLELVRWVAQLPLTLIGESIEYASMATAKTVTHGFLRNREDIAAILHSPSNDDSDLLELTQVLCVVGRKPSGKSTLSLIYIQPPSSDFVNTQLSPLKHLISWELPSPARTSETAKQSPQYSLHASSGVIYVLTDVALLSYDFTDTVPKLCSELTLSESGAESFLRLSQDVVFTTSSESFRIFDAKFNTLQALHTLDPAAKMADATNPTKKRKLTQTDTEEQRGQHYLVAYYADHDLVVAVRESEIIGMQLDAPFTRKRIKTDGTLLSDALSKGIVPPFKDSKPRETQKWQERKVKLDRYVSKGKIKRFEEALAADLCIELEANGSQKKRENEVNRGPLTNGVSPKIPDEDALAIELDQEEDTTSNLRSWKTSRAIPDARQEQSRRYATYALSRIFRPTEAPRTDGRLSNSLKIEFFPPNVFQWLLQTGHLSVASVRHAILEETHEIAQAFSLATDGEIVRALVEFDPDLYILSAILNDSGHLPVGEVVQAIKTLMQSMDEQLQAPDSTKMLTNGNASSEEEMDVDITSELEAASHEIDHALSMLDHGLLTRSHTLRPALIRLHSFSPRIITSTLRSMLPRRDLESLIRLLHLEMKHGGWSSSYDASDSELPTTEPASESPDDHAVAIIASLLGCTLDAIGAGAWLASVESPTEAESSEGIIQNLYKDTSEALNGFWEARYMRGLLGEFLRFASNVPKSQKPSTKSLEKQAKPFSLNKVDGELPMLPLGAKPDMGVERTKAGKGGKREERSKREMGMLISKRVPKYSFEKIVI